jgi:hypothetical protein
MTAKRNWGQQGTLQLPAVHCKVCHAHLNLPGSNLRPPRSKADPLQQGDTSSNPAPLIAFSSISVACSTLEYTQDISCAAAVRQGCSKA